MSALIPPRTTPEEELAARAAGRRTRAVDLRWAARCEEMEAVLDDLAAGLLPRPDITHVVGYTCEGIDCRYDKGFTPTDHDIFPHLHLDAVVCTAADGSRVLLERLEVPLVRLQQVGALADGDVSVFADPPTGPPAREDPPSESGGAATDTAKLPAPHAAEQRCASRASSPRRGTAAAHCRAWRPRQATRPSTATSGR